MGVTLWKEKYPVIALDIVSKRGEMLTLNIQNDRPHMEL
jgi:hypothetical protein